MMVGESGVKGKTQLSGCVFERARFSGALCGGQCEGVCQVVTESELAGNK